MWADLLLFKAARALRRPGWWFCGDDLRLFKPRGPQPPHAEARNSLSLRLRALRRLRPTVANRRGRQQRPDFKPKKDVRHLPF